MPFTEQGVAMLSSVLRSPRAMAVNVEIIRAFVQLRQLLATHAELARKLDELRDRTLLPPATMRRVELWVVLAPDGREIFNAYPSDRSRRR